MEQVLHGQTDLDGTGDDRLSVTLAEIVHIRSVMTKAELEGLPMDVRVKEDVEKRRVCFLCLRTRFSFFGPWGIQCKLCQRTVCAKCYTKVGLCYSFPDWLWLIYSISRCAFPRSTSGTCPLCWSHHRCCPVRPARARPPHPITPSRRTRPRRGTLWTTSSPSRWSSVSCAPSQIERWGLGCDFGDEYSSIILFGFPFQTRSTVGSAPSSPKHQRSNMSTPGISVGPGASSSSAAGATGQAVEALHDQAVMSASYSAAMRPSGVHPHQRQHYNNAMSRSMEGPRSLPVHSPAYRPLSNNSTLERKWVSGATLKWVK